jgi:hypothetical protein
MNSEDGDLQSAPPAALNSADTNGQPAAPEGLISTDVAGSSAIAGVAEEAGTTEEADVSMADETLAALDTLEDMLTTRDEAHAAPANSAPEPPLIESDGQYSIPLLDDVVLPGMPDIERQAMDHSPVNLSPMAQRLFDRLASEIDVIVQTGVDDALKAAAKNIRARVKQHVAIVLPEILDELSHEDNELE